MNTRSDYRVKEALEEKSIFLALMMLISFAHTV